MKAWTYKPLKRNRFFMALIIIFLAFLLNYIPSRIAQALDMPLFLDSIGTLFAAMLGGNLPAVIAGFCGNAANGISNIATLYYCIISVMIGSMAAIFQRNGFFKSFGRVLFTILVFALLGGGLGSILTYFLQGDGFGAGKSAPFALWIYGNLGFSKFFSQFCADIIIDFFDKSVTVSCSLLLYHSISEKSKRLAKFMFLFFPDSDDEYRVKLHDRDIRRSLIKKVVVLVITAEILLGTLASVTAFILYREVALGKFTGIAHGVTKAASVVIDSERLDEFLEKGRTAEGYAEIEQNLYKIKESFPQTMYLYVYKIEKDGCHVVFDLDSEGGVEASQPGEIMEFDPTFVPYLPKLLKGEEIEPIISDDQFGKLLTVYKPLKGSTYVAADITISEITADEAKFVIKLLSMFFGLSIIIMSIVLEFVNRGIVYPVNRMAVASIQFAYNLGREDSDSLLKGIEALKIHTFDEIEYLYRAIMKMGGDSLNYIGQLHKQTERIMRMQEEIILNFAEMVEARDNSTGNHIKKTAFYVGAIAKELRKNGKFTDILTDAYIAKLKRSAPLHDIGKIAVPDSILNKPGKLTAEEFEIMKTHSIEGQKILKKIEANASDSMDDDYLKESIEMALYHHEKWNGTGYPNGLRGEDIPLSARIMAVADVFDALVAERVYKKAMSYEKAMEIILEGAGTSFDPVIVEAFSHIAKDLYDKRTILEQ